MVQEILIFILPDDLEESKVPLLKTKCSRKSLKVELVLVVSDINAERVDTEEVLNGDGNVCWLHFTR